jgi:OOP family OmpA-OmpF porin
MKMNFKKTAMLLSGVLLSGSLFAQTDTTSTSTYVTPFSGGSAFRTWSFGIHAGLLTPYTVFRGKEDFTSPNEQLGYGGYIKKQILPSFGLQANFFRGKVQGAVQAGSAEFQKYRTQIEYAADLSANFTLANINWRHQKGFIQPYLSVGGGLIGYKPELTRTDGTITNFRNDNSAVKQLYIPVGAGLKINLAKGVNLDLGYQVNFVDADNFDGYNFGSTYDKFSYAHAGLEFALGRQSKPQMATHNPVASMRTEYMMRTQDLQAELALQKAQNDQLRTDLNTTNSNLAKLTVDTDGDGVFDIADKCPNTPSGVKVDGSGCPLPKAETKVYITEEDKRVVSEAIRNLEFDFGKATIRDRSYPSLDRVADLLVQKNFSLKLAGHTDNVGSDAANLKLSKDRAESIKAYLVGKGANASRIEATGYGESQPIASNKTDAGRQQNRRVEFTLY